MHDEGSATLMSVIAGMVIVCCAACVFAFVETAAVRHRLAGVADLVALAAAQSFGNECDRAREMAEINGANLVACALDSGDVVVGVDVATPPLTAQLLTILGRERGRISAQARAGW